MATDLGTKSPSPAVKYEAFVEKELDRVRSRIRLLDVGMALLGFLVVTLAYALGMVLLERFVGLESGGLGTGVRLAAFVLYGAGALFFLGLAGLRLYRRINPYFAARQLEQTLPDAKNSMVNWLDLRDEKLPPAIRVAVGQKAARDLKKADPEQATNPGPVWLLTCVAAALVLALLVLWVTGPNQFLSLLSRAFFPLRDTSIATRTELTLLEPREGDLTVPLGQPVRFRVQLAGRVPRVNEPDAAALHFRYARTDEYMRLPLDEDVDRTWALTLVADRVRTGFWYKITAGDAETPEYEVRTQSEPQVLRYDVSYKYRPYLKVPAATVSFPNETAARPKLKAHRGTEVTLVTHANRLLGDARIEFETGGAKKELAGELLADDPRAARFRFVLERPGHFRVLFTSRQGEANGDRSPHPMEVIEDTTPLVTLTKPGPEVKLPANGTLQVEGVASDDFGIQALALQMRVVEGGAQPALAPKAYRPGKSFKFVDETYPDRLDYKDFVALDKLKTAGGEPFALKPGMVLEYWLEARDCSDYPDKDGNLGKSEPPFKLYIVEPQKDPKQQQKERQQAANQQKEFEKNQDQKHGEQNEQIQQEQQQQKNDAKSGDPKQDEKQRRNDDIQKRLENELKKDQEQKKGEAQGSEQDQPKADKKEGETGKKGESTGQAKDSKDPGAKQNAGEQKDSPKEQQPDAAQAKGDGRKEQGKQPDSGQARNDGDKKSQPGAQGSADKKDEQKGKDQQAGSAKASGSDKSKEQPGQAKDQGDKGGEAGGQQAGQAQSGDSGADMGDKQQKAENKAEGKGEPNAQAKDQTGGPGKEGAQAKGQPKQAPPDAGSQAKGQDKKGGQENPGTAKGPNQGKDGGEQAPGQAQGARPEEAKSAQKAPGKDGGAGAPPEATAKESQAGKQKNNGAGQGKASPDPGQDAGEARSDGQLAQGRGQAPSNREPTLDDIAKLKEKLDKAGPKGDDQAARELERAGREAKDQQVRDAAKDALDKLGKGEHGTAKDSQPTDKDGPGSAKAPGEEGMEGGTKQQPAQAKGGPPKDQQAGKAQGQGGGQQDPGKIARQDNEPGGKVGTSGPSGGITEEPKARDPNEEFARRGGEMQLEDLKKVVTPGLLKRAGITEQEWQEFLRGARAYDKTLQARPKTPGKVDLRGGPTGLRGGGPRRIGPGGQQQDPLSVGRGVPPPEFRDAHRQFTRVPVSPPEKKK